MGRMAQQPVARWENTRTGVEERAAYEHPWAVRFCHWLNSISLVVLGASGLQILWAFTSFGPKIPERDFWNVPGFLRLGGWLGGALQWHFTFIWIYVGTGLVYLGYQAVSGNWRQIVFLPRDVRGVWPMARHYFFFGKKPAVTEPYNPLQKLAYTSVIGLGIASAVTGAAIYKPVQLSWLTFLLGGFRLARLWHFLAFGGFVLFLAGHLVMVALHGWNNFVSMLTGWKKGPEYLP
jgi:thiosulfate reductase cytochrome b subunit